MNIYETKEILPKEGIYSLSVEYRDLYMRKFYTRDEHQNIDYIILKLYRDDKQVEPSMIITLTVKEATALGYLLVENFKHI